MAELSTQPTVSAAAASEVAPPGPCTVVIFGASGDLTRRKLLPALWNLQCEARLPKEISVVGMARTEKSDDAFREEALQGIKEHSRFREPDPEKWRHFAGSLFYLRAQYDDPKCYGALGDLLDRLCDERGSCGNRLFYLSTPPSGYGEIVEQLGEAGLASDRESIGWSRLIVEKPFGHDLESARDLNAHIKRFFRERQIYRIDHYLG